MASWAQTWTSIYRARRNERIYSVLKDLANEFLHVPITIQNGDSHAAMAAADVVLLASGTATLEALCSKNPWS